MDPINNAQPPSAPSNKTEEGLPPSPNEGSELYAQIAREDTDPFVVKKKNKPLLVQLMAAIMRLTLYVDSLKHTHERVFSFLGIVWMLWMAVLFLSGILVLLFAVYNWLQLPIYLEDQLQARNIQFESVEYDTDRIVVRNLKDEKGMYTVDNMLIYSTFADLLQKRFRLVSLDGLNIFVDGNSETNVLEDIPQFLSRIQSPVKGRLDVTVNAVTVNNAKLIFKDKNINIPVSFSMEGNYDKSTRIVIPFSVDQPALRANGNLVVSGTNVNPEWILTITKAKVTLPRSAPEDLTGEIKMAMDRQALSTIHADLVLGYGTIKKHITADFKKKDEKALSGQVVWERDNLTEPEYSSSMTFDIDRLSIKDGVVRTQGPLSVYFKQFYATDFVVKDLKAPLDAEIVCQNWSQCEVHFRKASKVTIQDLQFFYQRRNIYNVEPVQFVLNPQENAIFIADRNPYLTFNMPMKDLVFEGRTEELKSTVSVNAKDVVISGFVMDSEAEGSQLALAIKGLGYKDSDFAFKDASLHIDNILQDAPKVQLSAQDMTVASVPLLSHPFNVSLNTLGGNSVASLKFKDMPLSVQLDGKFSFAQRTFTGNVFIPPFELKELNSPVQSFWAGIPDSLSNFSGQVAAKGKLTWLGNYNVAGPLYVGLKDVSFDVAGTPISGVNTIVLVETLAPFTTKKSQHVVINSIENIIPFRNLDAIFQVDNQNLRVSKLSVLGGGIPLVLPPSVIATKNANALIALKNESPIDSKQFQNAMNLYGIDVRSGSASVSIPIEIKNDQVRIQNAVMKMQSVLLDRQNKQYENIFGTSSSYFIRSGQVIMDQNKILQLAFNGRILPSKAQKDIQLNRVVLPDSFFKPIAPKDVPQDIERNLNALFGE